MYIITNKSRKRRNTRLRQCDDLDKSMREIKELLEQTSSEDKRESLNLKLKIMQENRDRVNRHLH